MEVQWVRGYGARVSDRKVVFLSGLKFIHQLSNYHNFKK